jgi:flagellar biosynthesis anti-sigma factor FlgM
MISNVNASMVRNSYQSGDQQQKIEKKESATVSKQGDLSKIDQIKESIEKGEYQVDLQALAEKIADDLL